jgi:bifunctional UDP-N-acetylglucosamine pyrophosphorylase/glucosamine-1-phosphate N-acetyltransferase
MPVDVVILAAGQGTRMNSTIPKVLHPIAGKPMLQHVIDAAREIGEVEISVVVGHGAELVRERIKEPGINWVHQAEQLGTGHAVQQAVPALRQDATVLVLYGDVPLVNPSTLKQLVMQADGQSMGLLTVQLDNPSGYGRVVRDGGQVVRIVEHKDATEEERGINEVNTGIMAINQPHLVRWLDEIGNDNSQGEYYLTDVIRGAGRQRSLPASHAGTDLPTAYRAKADGPGCHPV